MLAAHPNRISLAVFEQSDARAEHEGFGNIVGDENHGLFQFLLERLELPLNLAPGDRIEGAERLVEQDHRRIGGERPRHADALALPAG